MGFQREKAEDILEEIIPLITEHYKEIAHYQDIPLEPDLDQYVALDNLGVLRIFTWRHEGQLIGYCIYFVRPNIHYKSSVQAAQDILYVSKEYRGTGGRFLIWCDKQLQDEGVQVVYQHVKVEHNFGPMLERMGYKLIDLIYGRRLD